VKQYTGSRRKAEDSFKKYLQRTDRSVPISPLTAGHENKVGQSEKLGMLQHFLFFYCPFSVFYISKFLIRREWILFKESVQTIV
jgi:hypothetical protein